MGCSFIYKHISHLPSIGGLMYINKYTINFKWLQEENETFTSRKKSLVHLPGEDGRGVVGLKLGPGTG